MRHHVDVPRERPPFVGGIETEAAGDAGVGEVEVDGAVFGFRLLDRRRDDGRVGHVAADRDRTDLVGDPLCRGAVEVDRDDARTCPDQPARQRGADPRGRPRHDRHRPRNVHRARLTARRRRW